MKTAGAMDASSLLSLNGGQASAPTQQPVPTQQYQQPAPAHTQQYQQPAPAPTKQYQQPQQSSPTQTKQHPVGTGVHLKKGQKFALTGVNGAQLTNVEIGLGWDLVNQACDLDASAFMLDASNRVIGDDWFVFYGQTTSPDGSVMHSGDSDGSGVGDDETIKMSNTLSNQKPA